MINKQKSGPLLPLDISELSHHLPPSPNESELAGPFWVAVFVVVQSFYAGDRNYMGKDNETGDFQSDKPSRQCLQAGKVSVIGPTCLVKVLG